MLRPAGSSPLPPAMRVLTLFEAPVVAVFEADFPFRFPPFCSKDREAEVGTRCAAGPGRINPAGRFSRWLCDGGKPIAIGAAYEAACVGEGGETLVEGDIANAAQDTQFADR